MRPDAVIMAASAVAEAAGVAAMITPPGLSMRVDQPDQKAPGGR